MRFAAWLFAVVFKFGGVGLLLLAIADSSFLFAPWGNDVLLVAMTARRPGVTNMLYYAVMSSVGSVIGCLLVDMVIRPLGAEGLERHLPGARIKRLTDKVRTHAATGLTVASLAPPPFPFTAFVMAAAALQYSRRKLLLLVGVTRLVRFVLLGMLALRYGKTILKWPQIPAVQVLLIVLVAVSIIGSIVSVMVWIRRSRQRPHAT